MASKKPQARTSSALFLFFLSLPPNQKSRPSFSYPVILSTHYLVHLVNNFLHVGGITPRGPHRR
ncbi:MAG TPA: hypothetical protein P5034_09560, partial [Rectinema sp.]|nr:hypothetical protein [Rectinema sp.]